MSITEVLSSSSCLGHAELLSFVSLVIQHTAIFAELRLRNGLDKYYGMIKNVFLVYAGAEYPQAPRAAHAAEFARKLHRRFVAQDGYPHCYARHFLSESVTAADK